MATSISGRPVHSLDPAAIHSPRDFTRILMKFQRATHLLASSLDCDILLNRVVNDIAATIGNVEVAVWLRDETTGDFVLEGVCGCTIYKKGSRLIPGRGMVGHSASTGKLHYAPDVRLDPYYIRCEEATLSSVTIPLKTNSRMIGVLCVDHEEINAFSNDQLALLQGLANHIAAAMENARLFRTEREERLRLQKESTDARAMQEAIFLKPVPLVPGFAFETAWHPAGAVAGDWFDFIDLGQQRYGIALADVSGKGMSAALLMSATRALLRSIALAKPSPAATLEQLNRTLLEDFPPGKFVTMIYGVLDAEKREITFANAGHLPPLLINGHCRFLELDSGLPLGLRASTYSEQAISLGSGTHVLLYSDGITEAANLQEDEFGPARLLEHFAKPDACVEGLIAEVKRHSVGSDHTDDATAVLIRSR